MAGLYDLMILLDPDAPEERQTEILAGVRSTIEGAGTLVGEHDWGRRKLAFEIQKRGEAAYHLLQFQGEPELLDRLRHNLKITDGVLRSRTIRLKPGSPPPPVQPRADGGLRREEDGDTVIAPRAAADA